MKVLFCIQLLIYSYLSLAKMIIISDIDDTIKQSNVLNKREMVKSIKLKTKEFLYLKRIFQEIKYDLKENVEFIYVSASLDCIVNQSKWLASKGFPYGKVIQRRCFSGGKEERNIFDNITFKVSKISEILEQLKTDDVKKILMFGDNAEKDPIIYKMTQKNYPKLNFEIFIRDIKVSATLINKILPLERLDGVNYFLSEYDLLENANFQNLPLNLKNNIRDSKNSLSIYPNYLVVNYSKRYEKFLNYEDEEAFEIALNEFKNFNTYQW